MTGVRLSIPAGYSPFAADRVVNIVLKTALAPEDDSDAAQIVATTRPGSDKSWECDLHWDKTKWQVGVSDEPGLHKRHGLQGPIDDAFMDSFIVVRPTGQAFNGKVAAWAEGELTRLVKEWRRHFRGDAIVKRDDEITAADIASSHLILFGDPQSNSVLGTIMDQLPISWSADQPLDATHWLPTMGPMAWAAHPMVAHVVAAR